MHCIDNSTQKLFFRDNVNVQSHRAASKAVDSFAYFFTTKTVNTSEVGRMMLPLHSGNTQRANA